MYVWVYMIHCVSPVWSTFFKYDKEIFLKTKDSSFMNTGGKSRKEIFLLLEDHSKRLSEDQPLHNDKQIHSAISVG